MRSCFAALGIIALIGSLSLPTQALVTPTFAPYSYLYWGTGQIIMTDNYGVVPHVADWNGDGVKDLLVGTYYYGNVYFYPNVGSNQNPVFMSRSQLSADGNPISVTYG